MEGESENTQEKWFYLKAYTCMHVCTHDENEKTELGEEQSKANYVFLHRRQI